MKPSDYIRKGWCQGASAIDDQGIVVHPGSTHAVAWCLMGSLIAAYPEDISYRESLTAKLGEKFLPVTIFTHWNDKSSRTKQEVIQLLESIGE